MSSQRFFLLCCISWLISPADPRSLQKSRLSILKWFCPETSGVCFCFHLPLCLPGTLSQIQPLCDFSKCNHLHTYGASPGTPRGPRHSSNRLVHHEKMELRLESQPLHTVDTASSKNEYASQFRAGSWIFIVVNTRNANELDYPDGFRSQHNDHTDTQRRSQETEAHTHTRWWPPSRREGCQH